MISQPFAKYANSYLLNCQNENMPKETVISFEEFWCPKHLSDPSHLSQGYLGWMGMAKKTVPEILETVHLLIP